MSVVTSIIIVGYLEEKHLRSILRAIKKTNAKQIDLSDVSELSEGDKGFQSQVYLLAINYFETAEFITEIRRINKLYKRKFPDDFQIFIKEEDDEKFREVQL